MAMMDALLAQPKRSLDRAECEQEAQKGAAFIRLPAPRKSSQGNLDAVALSLPQDIKAICPSMHDATAVNAVEIVEII